MAEPIPVDQHIAAYWAKNIAALKGAGVAPPHVAVLPDYNSWNDYGRRFLAKLLIVAPDGKAIRLDFRMLVEDRNVTSAYMDELFAAEGACVPIDRAEPGFVSQLIAPDDYRKVIAHLGFELGVTALRAVGDAVVAKMEGLDETRLRLAASEEFHIGVLRNPPAYEASIKGARFIRPDPIPEVNDAAQTFTLGAMLPSADNAYVMKLDFDPDPIFKDRINVLIGRNGTGKTLAICALIGRLTQGGIAGDASRHTVLLPRPRASRVIMFATAASNQYPEEIAPWRGIDYAYYPVAAAPIKGADPLLAALVAAVRGDREFSFEIDKVHYDRADLLRQAIGPLRIWNDIHLPLRPPGPNDKVNGVEHDGAHYHPLHKRLDELGTVQLAQRIDWERSPILINPAGGIRQLSSGELVMLRFAAQATLAIEKGSLLLLDEPETHLHPNFISDLMEMLHNLLASTGSIAVIATHSAYVVREVPRRRVNILTLQDRRISITTPRMQTFGASVDAVSQFVFGDTMFAHRYQRALEQWVETEGAALGLEKILERHGAELNRESLSYIARLLADRDAGAAAP